MLKLIVLKLGKLLVKIKAQKRVILNVIIEFIYVTAAVVTIYTGLVISKELPIVSTNIEKYSKKVSISLNYNISKKIYLLDVKYDYKNFSKVLYIKLIFDKPIDKEILNTDKKVVITKTFDKKTVIFKFENLDYFDQKTFFIDSGDENLIKSEAWDYETGKLFEIYSGKSNVYTTAGSQQKFNTQTNMWELDE